MFAGSNVSHSLSVSFASNCDGKQLPVIKKEQNINLLSLLQNKTRKNKKKNTVTIMNDFGGDIKILVW